MSININNRNSGSVEKSTDIIRESGNLFNSTVDKSLSYSDKLSEDIKQAKNKVIEENEKASIARMDTFSNEKGREANLQYKEYIEGSVAESFAIKTKLFEEKQRLLDEISKMRSQLQEERLDAELEIKRKLNEVELEIKRKQNDAEIELERVKKQISEEKKPKKTQLFWNIICPILGIALGALTYFLLSI